MARTQLSDIAAQIQEFWSDLFMQELREKMLLGSLVNRDYEGEIRQLGDTVKVSQINAPEGQLLTVGTNADSFSSEKISTSQVEVKADKRAVASYEIEDLVLLQSQLGNKDSEIRSSLMFSVMRKINDELYSKVSPSTSAPDHTKTGVTDFNASEVSTLRKLAGQARWNRDKPWWLLVDPSYNKDLLDSQTLTSSDFIGPDQPVVGGQIVSQRFGFNILEDDSRGIQTLSAADSEDMALAFHPDFLLFVMQTQPTFKLSDLHSNKQFGSLLSVDVVFGSKLGVDGGVRHATVVATA